MKVGGGRERFIEIYENKIRVSTGAREMCGGENDWVCTQVIETGS